MKSKLLFRLETEDGTGIYRARSAYDLFPFLMGSAAMRRHPGPGSDKILGPEWDKLGADAWEWRFGFRSIRQLMRWFSKTQIKVILKNKRNIIGFTGLKDADPVYLAVYRGRVIHGEKQSIIHWETARRVAKFNLNILLTRKKKLASAG